MARTDRTLLAQVRDRLSMSCALVTPLEGGSRNRSYRLKDAGHDVVLRVDGDHDEMYSVAREAEHAAQRLAAGHGLAPRLLLTGTGFAVTEFVPGPPWSRERAASVEGAERVGAWLARLHALSVPAQLRPVRFLDCLECYAAQAADPGVVTAILAAGRRVARELGEPVPVVCHNDLHHLNLLESGSGLVAIDWEYAGAGDPRLDLAGYVAYHDLDSPAASALLRAYAAESAELPREQLDKARWLFEAVWWAWLELRRRLEGGEPDTVTAVRNRLLCRLEASDV